LTGCLVCLDELDLDEAHADLGGPALQQVRRGIYGLDQTLIGQKGPSVVSINGVIASLGVTEFAVAVSGIRSPKRLLKYYGNRGIVVLNNDVPHPDCYYCYSLRGSREGADVERYLREGVGEYLK